MSDGDHQSSANAWREYISVARADELEQILANFEAEKDHHGRRGSFDSAQIEDDEERKQYGLTGADVFWLYRRYERTNPLDASQVHLEGAWLDSARLQGALLGGAHLEGAYLASAQLEGAALNGTHLEDANLEFAHLDRAVLSAAQLRGAKLVIARLEEAHLEQARLEGADMASATLVGAVLDGARLEGANLFGANFRGAHLYEAHMESVNLTGARLDGADLRRAFFNDASQLEDVTLVNLFDGAAASVADVHWGNVNLSVVDWSRVRKIGLGDELAAKNKLTRDSKPKKEQDWLYGYQDAVRAHLQLAVALQNQGLD
jgi:uncharacterized protein YjbI with pentapeptide repeats